MRFYFRVASKITGVNAANNILCNSHNPFIVRIFIVKPLPNGLASRRKSLPSFRLVSDLRFVWPPTCVNLRWLALTWSTSNSHASRRKFFTVWPPNANQHKWIARHLYKREILRLLRLAWTYELTCESVWPSIASPYASFVFANFSRVGVAGKISNFDWLSTSIIDTPNMLSHRRKRQNT